MTEAAKQEVKIPTREEILNGDEQATTESATSATPGKDSSDYTEVEQSALKQGWKPKDQWEGDPDQHRSAREYLDRGELLGKIKSQNAKLDEFNRTLAVMSEHNKRVYAAGYEKALGDLKLQKKEALREGDADAVMEIDDKIDETKEALRNIKNTNTTPQGPSVTTQNWLQENEWYAKDRVMRAAANEMAVEYVKSHANASEEQIYDYIDKEIRKELPEKFGKKAATSAPNPDGQSRKVTNSGGKSGMSFEALLDTMDDDQARIARTLVKTGALTKEKYVEDYQKMFGKGR